MAPEERERDDLEMATRHHGPELGRWNADHSPSGDGAVLVRLVPERWRTKDYGKLYSGGTDAS